MILSFFVWSGWLAKVREVLFSAIAGDNHSCKSQQAFTCSKSAMKVPEQSVKSVQSKQ